jgi:TRAP-type C4-dicarboxylate transport system permease small subunit
VEALRRFERGLLAAEKWVLVTIVVVMVLLSFLQVILRGFFSVGILWADTFLRHLVLWIGFIGAAVAASENKQFAMDAANRVLKGKTKALVGIITHLFTLVVSGVLAKASWQFFCDEKASKAVLFSIGDLHVQTWLFELILPGGFILIAVHYTIKLVLEVNDLISGKPQA